MEKRPRPAEPAPADVASDAAEPAVAEVAEISVEAASPTEGELAPAEPGQEPGLEASREVEPPAAEERVADSPDGAVVDESISAPAESEIAEAPQPEGAEGAEGAAIAEPAEAETATAEQAEAALPDQTAPEGQSEPKEKPEEPAFIEVWRPGWPEERRPRRHARGGKRPSEGQHERSAESGAETQPASDTASADAPLAAGGEDQGRPPRGRPDRGDRGDRGQRGNRPDRPREGRRSREGQRDFSRQDRGERRGDRPRPDRRDDRREERRYFAKTDERRGKEPDPDSPFAKLAALKAQLEANAKDGH